MTELSQLSWILVLNPPQHPPFFCCFKFRMFFAAEIEYCFVHFARKALKPVFLSLSGPVDCSNIRSISVLIHSADACVLAVAAVLATGFSSRAISTAS